MASVIKGGRCAARGGGRRWYSTNEREARVGVGSGGGGSGLWNEQQTMKANKQDKENKKKGQQSDRTRPYK